MSHTLGCVMSLAYWECSTEEQGMCALFIVMGMMAHVPGYSATSGRPTLLLSGLEPTPSEQGVVWLRR
jgi:hypothetical protein